MHKIILNNPDLLGDHINGNTLDNRKINLRDATKSQNSMNRDLPTNNKSGYRGVSLYSRTGYWIAQIKINKKGIYLGYFKNKIDAINARKKAEKYYFKEFVYVKNS